MHTCIVIGDTNSGKLTFIKKYKEMIPDTTFSFIKFTGSVVSFEHNRNHFKKLNIACAIVTFDLTTRKSTYEQELNYLNWKMATEYVCHFVPKVFVGTKCDLLNHIAYDDTYEFLRKYENYMWTSGKNGYHIEEPLLYLEKLL